ncbi:MAG: MBL fold metallo-hydrolase [Deltaproteobacteria bacterium]|nr:MBL fold metallo-hydrolase [Deltaproteobacteria bacterium]
MKAAAEGDFGEFIAIGGNLFYPGYIVKGSRRRLMIDAGINLMGPAYIASLQKLFGDPNRLDYVFATHSHYDHLGAIPYLKRKLTRLKAGAHPRVGELMKKRSVLELMSALSAPQRELFRTIAGDEDVHIEPVDFEVSLKQGDRFDLGGVSCEVHGVPGHTRDSLAFFIPEVGALFAGEACGVLEGDKDGRVQVEFLSSYEDYLASLDKMIALRPRLIGMAHLWVFTGDDATEFLLRSRDETPRYRELIERYLDAANGDVDQAVLTMAKTEYDEKGTITQPRDAYVENLKAQVRHVALINRKT